jgi:hypothetical protein
MYVCLQPTWHKIKDAAGDDFISGFNNFTVIFLSFK